MTPHSLEMLDTMQESGVLSKEAAVRIEQTRNTLLEKVALAFVEAGDDEAEIEKVANFLGEMLSGGLGMLKNKVNPELLHKDPGVYNAMMKAYQEGAKDARKMLPQSAMSMGSPWRTAAAVIALATGARALGEAASVTGDRMRRRALEQDVAKSKSQIFDLNPQLLEDKAKAEAVFDELARFAPAIAASPPVATNFVSSAMTRTLFGNAPAIDPTQASQLLQAQRTYEQVQEHISPSKKRMGDALKQDIGQVLKAMLSGDIF